MFYQLPPVGNPISLTEIRDAGEAPENLFTPYSARYYDSGTSALAAAMRVAVSVSDTRQPEVLLPAYGCPDLVSAAVFAGAKPVLVDLEPERPWMDLEQLGKRMTTDTVAVVAVDLFGIPERMSALRNIVASRNILLIEDSAQAFPYANDEAFWSGDLVVLSFGRGKPVSLLGGGAILTKRNEYQSLLPDYTHAGSNRASQPWLFQLEAAMYNCFISPWLYWIPQGVPFLKLGETRYRAVEAIRPMDDSRLRLLTENVARFRNFEPGYRELRRAFAKIIPGIGGIIDLPMACDLPDSRRLLRYPILVEAHERERIYSKLKKNGLGPSLMYPSCLSRLEGLERILDQPQPTPRADNFASRLLTLPLHDRVREKDILKIQSVLSGAR